MRNFKKLNVWSDGIQLAVAVYQQTRSFPKEEMYGLISQMRRAAISISSNIAEGSSRNTDKERARFVEIAIGSAYELETQLLISCELGYISATESVTLIEQVTKLQQSIGALIKHLRAEG